MGLRLELALSSRFGEEDEEQQQHGKNRKRCFEEAFLGVDENALKCDYGQQRQIKKVAVSKRNGEALVGWPPVKSWRKEFSRRRCIANYVNVENGNGGAGGRGANSTYVKVKMEGVGIGRKVDLSIHNSYQSLTAHLIAMFGKFGEDAEQYELIYDDKGGDCLLAGGNVPWETFVESVQRMKLQRNRRHSNIYH